MSCDEFHDLIPGYAAAALEEAERSAVESHLDAGCSRCQEALVEAQALLADVSLSLDPVEPPPQLRERLLSRVRAETAADRGRRLGFRPALLAAGIAALVAGAVVAVLSSQTDGSDVPTLARVEQLEALLAEQEEELGALLAEQDEELGELELALREALDSIELLRSPDIEQVALAGVVDQASARVFWSWDDYSCYFVAEGLAALPSGATYSLWLFTEAGGIVHAGAFAPDAKGGASFFTLLPREMGRVARTLVTVEPQPRGDEPAGAPYLEPAA